MSGKGKGRGSGEGKGVVRCNAGASPVKKEDRLTAQEPREKFQTGQWHPLGKFHLGRHCLVPIALCSFLCASSLGSQNVIDSFSSSSDWSLSISHIPWSRFSRKQHENSQFVPLPLLSTAIRTFQSVAWS